MNSQDYAKELHRVLIEKERMEANLARENKLVAHLIGKLNETMLDEGIDAVEIDGIKYQPVVEESFALDPEKCSTDKWDDSPEWFGWLRSNGHGDMIKTKDSVHHKTRDGFLKSLLKDNQMIPDFINIKYFNTIKYNKSAIERLANGKGD